MDALDHGDGLAVLGLFIQVVQIKKVIDAKKFKIALTK